MARWLLAIAVGLGALAALVPAAPAAAAGTSIGDAQVLTGTVSGQLTSSAGVQDWYVVYPASTTDQVAVTVSNTSPVSSTCGLNADVLDPDGLGLGGASPVSGQSVPLTATGFDHYYIEVFDDGCDQGTTPPSYQVVVQDPAGFGSPPDLPTVAVDGGASEATATQLSGDINYEVASVTQTDEFFGVSTGGAAQVPVTNSTQTGDPCGTVLVTVLNSSGNAIGGATLLADHAATLSLPDAGTYYLDFNNDDCPTSPAGPVYIDTFNVNSTFALKVQRNGPGSGTVSSGDGNISCGSACSHSGYASGTQVTLTETPANGSTFAGWSGGGCSGTASTCTVTMSSNQTVTATFNTTPPPPPPTYTLSVQKSGTGSGTVGSGDGNISCGSACSHSRYASGTQVTLTEVPANRSTFAGWSGGGCSGTASTCTVTMTSNQTVTATFNTPPQPPTTTRPSCPTGSGNSSSAGSVRVVFYSTRGSSEHLDKDQGLGTPARALYRLLRAGPGAVLTSQANRYPASDITEGLVEDWDYLWAFPGLGRPPGLKPYLGHNYDTSVSMGVANGLRDLTTLANSEPAGCRWYVVVSGYSQGAEVTRRFVDHLPVRILAHVAVIVLYGDPLFEARELNVTTLGGFARGTTGARRVIPPKGAQVPRGLPVRTYSYCRVKDIVCGLVPAGAPLLAALHKLLFDAATGFPENQLRGDKAQVDKVFAEVTSGHFKYNEDACSAARLVGGALRARGANIGFACS